MEVKGLALAVIFFGYLYQNKLYCAGELFEVDIPRRSAMCLEYSLGVDKRFCICGIGEHVRCKPALIYILIKWLAWS